MQWLTRHPQYLTNMLYVGGDSYSGIPLPMIVKKIYQGKSRPLSLKSQNWTLEFSSLNFCAISANGNGTQPFMNIKVST